ncbi:MAG: ATP-binding protein [Kofleriaceae bacterium]
MRSDRDDPDALARQESTEQSAGRSDAEFDRVRAALEAEVAEHRVLSATLERERSLLRTMIDLIPSFIYAKDVQSRFIACNHLVARGMATTPENVIGKTDFDFFPRDMAERFFADEQMIIASGQPLIDHEEQVLDQYRGTKRFILTSKVPVRDSAGTIIGIVGTGRDITERKEREQHHAVRDRLESIGRLAAGIAHEINTPVQYVSDSAVFIRESVYELLAQLALDQLVIDPDSELAYLRRELPGALDRVRDGLTRIAEIVRSMKDFSHPDQRERGQVDLNRAIRSILVVARSEYRDVAEVQTELGELPFVTCHGGEINQVVLNLVINAAHAIADVVEGTPCKGLITVRTLLEGTDVVIQISDTGGGIPEAIRDRVFDPFFTTKEVGRGTGQGLSIARDVIVKGHGGSLSFQSEPTQGTTFVIRLPVDGGPAAEPVAGPLPEGLR